MHECITKLIKFVFVFVFVFMFMFILVVIKHKSLLYAVWHSPYLKQSLNPFVVRWPRHLQINVWFLHQLIYLDFLQHKKSLYNLVWTLELHLFWRVSFSIKPAIHNVKFKHRSSVRHVGSSTASQEEEEEEKESVWVEASERSVSHLSPSLFILTPACCPHCFHCIMTSSLLAVWPFRDSHWWIVETRDYRDITQCVHVCVYTQTCGLVEHWVQALC